LQQAAISIDKLEPELKEKVMKLTHPPKELYFNKGL
jgi:hypothetical protein